MRRAVALTAVLMLLLGACSSANDDESNEGANATPGAATATVAKFEATETGPDTGSLKGPESVKAGLVEIQLVNSGKKHHAALLAVVDAPHTQEEMLEIVESEGAPVPSWLHLFGGPIAPAGTTVPATVNLKPGSYYVFDFEPVDEEADSSPSFAAKGSVTKLEVTGTAKEVALPKADITVAGKEYSFDVTGLASGPKTIELKNTGQQHHHLLAFPYAEGATFVQVKEAFMSDDESPTGPPPVDFANTVELGALGPGGAEVTTVDFKPGKYAFVCFLSDERNPEKTSHFIEGMFQEVEIS